MWAALGFFIGWVALPVVIFPLDETLDPAQLAVFPIPRPRLLLGLAIASLIGPSVVVPVALVGSNVWVQTGWASSIAIVAGLVFIGPNGSGLPSFHRRHIRSAQKPPGP